MQKLNNQGLYRFLFYYSKKNPPFVYRKQFLINLIIFYFKNFIACEKSFKIRKSWEKAAKKLKRQEINMKLGAVNIDDSKFFINTL